MSYRGRPSKGCEQCRTRKIKCDETKPVCSRCSKSGHDCKYRDQADLLFRNQTAFAAQKAEASWRKRSKSNQQANNENTAKQSTENTQNHVSPSGSHDSPHSETTSEDSATITNFNSLSITQGVKPDIRRLAYERFLYDFVIYQNPNKGSDEPNDSMWSFVPDMYKDAAEGSCYAMVVEAVSYRNFANRCNAPECDSLAAENMGKSIKLLQKMIVDQEQAPSDEALASAYLMGVYENLTTPKRDGSYLAHSGGNIALLQLRNIEEFYSDHLSARIYEVSFSQMLIGSLQAAIRPQIPIRNVAATKEHLPMFYSTSGIYVIQLIHSEANLHARWHEVKRGPNPPTSRMELREILQNALDLDAEFQAWESTLPRTWRYQFERNNDAVRSTFDLKWRDLILASRGAPEEIHSYTSLKKSWIWNFYRTTRMFLLRDILEILNWMFRFPEPDQSVVAARSVLDPSDAHGSTKEGAVDNVTLHIHHAFASTHLVNVIEKTCAAVIGTFTVPIYGKSFDDVMGMRGYALVWSLAYVDSALKAGLVPDLEAPRPSQRNQTPSHQQEPQPSLPYNSTFFQFHNMPMPSPELFRMPPENMHKLYHQPVASTPQYNQFPPLPPFDLDQLTLSSSDPMDLGQSPPAPIVMPSYDPSGPDRHIWDHAARHPFDRSMPLPPLDFNITTPKRMDVAARREWINRILYYIATQLGFKKALVVPTVEGYLDIVKPQVDLIISRNR